MADYARRGDQADWMRSQSEQIRRMRTARPRRGGVPSPGWSWYGEVTLDTYFSPQLVTLDPREEGDYPEYKRIVGFDGWLLTGSVTVNWYSYDLGVTIHTGHVILGGAGITNRVMLDEPHIITYGPRGGEMIHPQVTAIGSGPMHLTCSYLVEEVPV